MSEVHRHPTVTVNQPLLGSKRVCRCRLRLRLRAEALQSRSQADFKIPKVCNSSVHRKGAQLHAAHVYFHWIPKGKINVLASDNMRNPYLVMAHQLKTVQYSDVQGLAMSHHRNITRLFVITIRVTLSLCHNVCDASIRLKCQQSFNQTHISP